MNSGMLSQSQQGLQGGIDPRIYNYSSSGGLDEMGTRNLELQHLICNITLPGISAWCCWSRELRLEMNLQGQSFTAVGREQHHVCKGVSSTLYLVLLQVVTMKRVLSFFLSLKRKRLWGKGQERIHVPVEKKNAVIDQFSRKTSF